MTSVSSRAAASLVIATVIVALVGARHLISGPLPVVRELVSGGSARPISCRSGGRRESGVGLGESSVPVGLVLRSALGTVLLRSIGLARRLLIWRRW